MGLRTRRFLAAGCPERPHLSFSQLSSFVRDGVRVVCGSRSRVVFPEGEVIRRKATSMMKSPPPIRLSRRG
jgi:hypothetical protein